MDYAIILAGGVGSRFWPLSRKLLPKQFLRIIGKDTFFEATIKRIQKVVANKNIFIVTNQIYLQEIKTQLRKLRIPQENIILEPKPLNTLPAIALCAQLINLRDKQANLLILPSDHYIKDNAGFKRTMIRTLSLSSRGFVCLIGVKPDSPCSGYGYIKTGKKIDKDEFYIGSFKEKPDLNTAKKLFKKSDIFWNAGIFGFRSDVILKEIRDYQPLLYSQIIRIRKKQDIGKVWPRINPISIDYGLLEKSKRLVMVKAKFYWRDLGSWEALCNVLSADRKGNIILSDCINLDSRNIFVCSYGSQRIIAAVGLQDIIIADTADALLVCRKDKSQDIKRLVELLKKKRKKCV